MFERLITSLTLTRWPLLLMGLTVMLLASGLIQPGDDDPEARGVMMGIGAVLLGAGLVRVIYRDGQRKDDEE